MVLGSHQFSRHANQRTHGSRTHRLSRRHVSCATVPLWHRPIYRQWGISPRPETAIASVARAGFRASMPRVIYGGDQLPQQPRLPLTPKWCAFRGFAAKQQPGHVSLSTTISAHADLKAVNAGNPGAGRGLLSGTFRRTQRGSAARSAMRSLFACPRTFRREAPVTPPDSRWEF